MGAPLPPGRVMSEGGFVDIDLTITSYQFRKDGSLHLTASAAINGQAVGFGLELAPKWKTQKPSNLPVPLTFYWGQAVIRSIGSESDAFVSLLSQKYGHGETRLRMVEEVPATAAILEGAPPSMSQKPFKMKVFFEHQGKDKYAEIFLNIDLEKKKLEFRDKDPEYHAGILASLGDG